MKTYCIKIATIATTAFAAVLCAAQQISVTVNKEPVQFSQAQPQYVHGRVLVPLRGVFEQMGAVVRWDEATRSVTAQKGLSTIKLDIGSKIAWIDDAPVALAAPAQVIDGSTMVPIRFLSEALGAQVGWNDQSRVVMITTDSVDANTQRPERMNTGLASVMEGGTVIPVVLNATLIPGKTEDGTVVSATLSNSNRKYGSLPVGSTIVGHLVSSTTRQDGGGTFALLFDRIKTPDGHSYPIEGSPITLDSRNAQLGGNGIWTAATEASQIWRPNMKLIPGTRFGIRLNRDWDPTKQ